MIFPVWCLLFKKVKGYRLIIHLIFKALHSLLEANNSNIKKKNRIKNPNLHGATSRLFTSVAEDFNSARPITNLANG